jgi:protein prenyltransferase alpha subunit repeat containing protein 1
MVPEMNELPLESQVYHPLVVFETKLGVAKSSLAELLKQSHQYFITLGKEDFVELEKVTRAMVLLKPDNYTAMNRRFRQNSIA